MQQLFVEALLRRADAALKSSDQIVSAETRLPEASYLVIALTHLESLLPPTASAYLERIATLKPALNAMLEVVKQALKAANTTEKARTLLGVSHLYSKFDSLRAFEVMREAVKTINQISEPDLSRPFVSQQIQGKNFVTIAGYTVEGFSLENVFRLLAPIDFDGALLMARSLDDKSLRAMASLALAAVCLESAPKADRSNDTSAPTPDVQDKPKKPAGKKRNP